LAEVTRPLTPKEWLRLGQAIARTMADSERTAEIHVAEELTGRRSYQRFLAETGSDPALAELLRDRPELRSDQVDYDRLRALPADTLGGAYVRHLDDNGLTADYQAAPTRYVDDEVIAYLMRRFRQTHDVWHALTGLGTAGHEEVIIHAFSWGQMRLPVSALVVVFGALKHLVLERRWRALRYALREAYESGRDAAPLLAVYWEKMWDQPLASVRARHAVRPCSPELVNA
jgi:ubiquinone biosynthesis protein COQ4